MSGKIPQPRKGGDVIKNANHSNRHLDAATTSIAASGASTGATGVTPLLLRRLQAIFDLVNGAEVIGEADMTARTDKLRGAGKEVHVISRAACALPPDQRALVMQLAENVKAIVTTLRQMSEGEAKVAAERYHAREAQRVEEGKTAAAAATTAAAEAPQQAPAPQSAHEELADMVPRFQQWATLLRSSEFAEGTLAAKNRAIAFATQDIHHGTALLDKVDDDALIDRVIAAIELATDATMWAKRLAKKQAEEAPAATEPATSDQAAAADDDKDRYSVSSLTEVLTEFHEALNAEELLQVEPTLRATLLGAILKRLKEIGEEIVPNLQGSDEGRKQAEASVATLITRAERLMSA